MPIPSTFAIVAWDRKAAEWGVAVGSGLLGVGSVVPWAEAGAGAIATQASPNVSYGPRGLELLRAGLSAEDVARRLLEEDAGRDYRQLAVVDQSGRVFAHTGRKCLAWAGQEVGEGFAVQGSILPSEDVVRRAATRFRKAPGRLAERLLAALAAGSGVRTDRLAQRSAALLVVRTEGGFGQYTDRAVDLRVEDHPEPVQELERIYRLHFLYFQPPDPMDQLPIRGELAQELAVRLQKLGYYRGPSLDAWSERLATALEAFHEAENIEGRILSPRSIDKHVLTYLRQRTGNIAS